MNCCCALLQSKMNSCCALLRNMMNSCCRYYRASSLSSSTMCHFNVNACFRCCSTITLKEMTALIAEVAKAYKTDHKLGSDGEAVNQMTEKLAGGKPMAHGTTVRTRPLCPFIPYRVTQLSTRLWKCGHYAVHTCMQTYMHACIYTYTHIHC